MKKRASIDDYFTIPELIEFLKCPKPTVYYWLKIRDIPSDALGHVQVILREDAKAFKRNNFKKVG